MYISRVGQIEPILGRDVSATQGFALIPLIPLAIGLGGAAVGAGIGYAFGRPAVDSTGNPQTAAGVFADRAGKGIATALTVGAIGFIAYKWIQKS